MSGSSAAATVAESSPAVQRHIVQQFAADFSAVGLARCHVASTLHTWGMADLTETLGLLVSELVTNACRASADRSAPVVATRLTCTDTDLIFEVWDANEAAPVRQDPGLDAEGGRGLLLVSALSTRWAFYRPRTGGKVVWFSLALPDRFATDIERAEPLPQRTAAQTTGKPSESFDDVAVLQRVVDALRALDWNLPPGDGARP